jgi:hypothetical protein
MERVESELDRIIEKRAREARDAAAVEELWAEQERRERERRRDDHRLARLEHERHTERLHASLSEEHRAKAEALAGAHAGARLDVEKAQGSHAPPESEALQGVRFAGSSAVPARFPAAQLRSAGLGRRIVSGGRG